MDRQEQFLRILGGAIKPSVRPQKKSRGGDGAPSLSRPWSAAEIVGEVMRDPGFCPHVANPLPPVLLTSVSPLAVMTLAEERAKVGCRWDGDPVHRNANIMFSWVASYPKTWETVRSSAEETAKYERWLKLASGFLTRVTDGQIEAIVLHVDEGFPHLHGLGASILIPHTTPEGKEVMLLDPGLLDPGRVARNEKKRAGEGKASRAAAAQKLKDLQLLYAIEVGVPCGHRMPGMNGPGRRHLSASVYRNMKEAAARDSEGRAAEAQRPLSDDRRAVAEAALARQQANPGSGAPIETLGADGMIHLAPTGTPGRGRVPRADLRLASEKQADQAVIGSLHALIGDLLDNLQSARIQRDESRAALKEAMAGWRAAVQSAEDAEAQARAEARRSIAAEGQQKLLATRLEAAAAGARGESEEARASGVVAGREDILSALRKTFMIPPATKAQDIVPLIKGRMDDLDGRRREADQIAADARASSIDAGHRRSTAEAALAAASSRAASLEADLEAARVHSEESRREASVATADRDAAIQRADRAETHARTEATRADVAIQQAKLTGEALAVVTTEREREVAAARESGRAEGRKEVRTNLCEAFGLASNDAVVPAIVHQVARLVERAQDAEAAAADSLGAAATAQEGRASAEKALETASAELKVAGKASSALARMEQARNSAEVISAIDELAKIAPGLAANFRELRSRPRNGDVALERSEKLSRLRASGEPIPDGAQGYERLTNLVIRSANFASEVKTAADEALAARDREVRRALASAGWSVDGPVIDRLLEILSRVKSNDSQAMRPPDESARLPARSPAALGIDPRPASAAHRIVRLAFEDADKGSSRAIKFVPGSKSRDLYDRSHAWGTNHPQHLADQAKRRSAEDILIGKEEVAYVRRLAALAPQDLAAVRRQGPALPHGAEVGSMLPGPDIGSAQRNRG